MNVKQWLVDTLSPERIGRFKANLYTYITGRCRRTELDFDDLDLIFKVTVKQRVSKNGFS